MHIQHQSAELIIFESALYRTTSSLIVGRDFLLLVDPNWLPIEVAFIQRQVAALRDGKPLYLLFTHADYDHIIGWRAFPDAQVIVSEAFENNPEKEKQLQLIQAFDAENYISRSYPIEYPKGDIVIDSEGQEVVLGEAKLRFYCAGGHTPEGLFCLIEPYGIWVAGDYLSNVEFPFVYHSTAAYLESMQKARRILDRFELQMMIPGHGDATADRLEVLHRIQASEDYLTELIESVRQRGRFDLEKWLEQYPYPDGLRKAQQENIALIQKELGI